MNYSQEQIDGLIANAKAPLLAEIEKLSKGLYDRIQNRSRYINLSAAETALDHIDFINLQNGELVEKAGALAQEIHDLRSHVGSFPICMEKPCYDAWVAVKQSRRTEKRKCPSRCSGGSPECEKLDGHKLIAGDVEHRNGQTVWF